MGGMMELRNEYKEAFEKKQCVMKMSTAIRSCCRKS